jgi:hypothetical protein
MTKDEALDLALEFVEANHSGGPDAFELITAIKQARALDKMAENARELGLDYEPVREDWGPGPHEYHSLPAQPAPEQEPVAWQVMVEDEAMEEFSVKDAAYDWCVQQKLAGSPYSYWIRPLYTTPTAQEFVCSTGLCHYKANKENT